MKLHRLVYYSFGLIVVTLVAWVLWVMTGATFEPEAGAGAPAEIGTALAMERPGLGRIPEPLSTLEVDDDRSGVPDYDRDAFPHWSDLDGDGCDTRQEVLLEEALGPVQRDPFDRCRSVVAGDWWSWLDSKPATSPGELEVDHLVPLEDAWYAGAHAWSQIEREVFANDQGNLSAVTVSVNRSKGSRTPDRWLPKVERCRYITEWIAVKAAWDLTVTTAERAALTRELETCS